LPGGHLTTNEQPEALASLIAKFERGLAKMQLARSVWRRIKAVIPQPPQAFRIEEPLRPTHREVTCLSCGEEVADAIRAHRQSQDRQGARHYHSDDGARARRRSDRSLLHLLRSGSGPTLPSRRSVEHGSYQEL